MVIYLRSTWKLSGTRLCVYVRSGPNWNLEMLVFDDRGKQEYPEKNLSEQGQNQQQSQPTYGAGSGNRNRVSMGGMIVFNPIQTGLFFVLLDRGGGGAVAPISNSENINATTMKLGGCIVCLKLFPLRSASWVDDVTWRGNYVMISKRWPYWSAILDF